MDEAALIRAAQGGDAAAFEQLVRAYDQSVLRLALNLLRSAEDANDIYQETFLRVFRNLHSFRFDCSFHTWLYRIVTNLCLDHMRKRKVRREEPTVIDTADGPLDRMDTVPEERAHGDPQRHLLSNELKEPAGEGAERTDAARADGVRDAALPGHAAARHRRSTGHQRRGRQELPVSRHAKAAGRIGRFSMNCEDARRSIPLIHYAETSFDEEEAVHEHLAECQACRAEFELGKMLHGLLDDRELELSPFLLRRSRDQLAAAIEAERAHHSWLGGLKSAFAATRWIPSFARPVGALALVALGFFGARFTPFAGAMGIRSAGLMDPSNSHVRYVESEPQGRVQLVVDETRQRVISGRIDDSEIRALLLSAAKDPSDPGAPGGIRRHSEEQERIGRGPERSDLRVAERCEPGRAIQGARGPETVLQSAGRAQGAVPGVADRRQSRLADAGHRLANPEFERATRGWRSPGTHAEGRQWLYPPALRKGIAGNEGFG